MYFDYKTGSMVRPENGEDGSTRDAAPGTYFDYKHGSMVRSENSEAEAAWAATAAKVSGGRIKARKADMEEEGQLSNIGDPAFAFPFDLPLRGRGDF